MSLSADRSSQGLNAYACRNSKRLLRVGLKGNAALRKQCLGFLVATKHDRTSTQGAPPLVFSEPVGRLVTSF
jgi:hypothetical protein